MPDAIAMLYAYESQERFSAKSMVSSDRNLYWLAQRDEARLRRELFADLAWIAMMNMLMDETAGEVVKTRFKNKGLVGVN